MNDSFFVVWNPSGQNPKFRHPNRQSAIDESERLARLNPGQEFFVLEAVELRFLDSMQRITLRPVLEEPPF